MCNASGCHKSHKDHFCKICRNPKSRHRARECPSLQLQQVFTNGHHHVAQGFPVFVGGHHHAIPVIVSGPPIFVSGGGRHPLAHGIPVFVGGRPSLSSIMPLNIVRNSRT
jgi:hypothetical protein